MDRYRELIERIREELHSSLTVSEETLLGLATEYGQACNDINRRMLQCISQLRAGNRSEAIRLAEAAPNLLEAYTILDFAEFDQWMGLLSLTELDAPLALNRDAATELNDAYTHAEAIEPLLRQHRLLALAQAPLAARLTIVRKLAIADAETAHWNEDVEVYEKERLKQLAMDVKQAVASKDEQRLRALSSELDNGDGHWTTDLPPSLKKEVDTALRNLLYQQDMAQLAEIGDSLNEAFSNFDVEDGVKLKLRWDSIAQRWNNTIPEHLVELTSPAFEWLTEDQQEQQWQREYEEALADIEEELLDEADADELELAYSTLAMAAERAGQEIPISVERSYRGRMESLQLRRARKFRLAIVGTVTALLLVGAGVFFLIRLHQHEMEVAATVDTLQQYLETESLEQADTYRKNLSENLLRKDEIARLIADLDQAIEAETERKELFAAAVQQAEESTSDVDDLDDDALSLANELARTENEKIECQRIDGLYSDLRRARQREIDTLFQEQFDELAEKVSQLKLSPGGIESIEPDELRALRTEVSALAKEGNRLGVSANASRQVSLLHETISGMQTAIQEKESIQDGLERLRGAIGDTDSFSTGLLQFIQDNPNAPCGADFESVAEEADMWQQVLLADSTCDSVNQAFANGDPTAEQASEFLASYETLNQEGVGELPSVTALAARSQYLESIIDREDSETLSELRKLIAGLKSQKFWLLRKTESAQDGERWFYLISEPEVDTANYFLVRNGQSKRPLAITAEVLPLISEAPQLALADELQKLVESLSDAEWCPTACSILQKAYANEELDPLIKFDLVLQLTDLLSRSDHCIEKGFAQHLELLNDADVDLFVDWRDPQSDATAEERRKAAAFLESLPDLSNAVRITADDYKAIHASRLPSIEWVGFLKRTDKGVWDCVLADEQPQDGDLITVAPSLDNTSIVCKNIGRITQGKCFIQNDNTALEGRPVFLEASN